MSKRKGNKAVCITGTLDIQTRGVRGAPYGSMPVSGRSGVVRKSILRDLQREEAVWWHESLVKQNKEDALLMSPSICPATRHQGQQQSVSRGPVPCESLVQPSICQAWPVFQAAICCFAAVPRIPPRALFRVCVTRQKATWLWIENTG